MAVAESDRIGDERVRLALEELVVQLNLIRLPLRVHLVPVAQEVLCIPLLRLDLSRHSQCVECFLAFSLINALVIGDVLQVVASVEHEHKVGALATLVRIRGVLDLDDWFLALLIGW